MLLTMVDGKVCNVLTTTSSQVCYICNAKPKEMNDIDRAMERPIEEKNLTFGLSTFIFFYLFVKKTVKTVYDVWGKKFRNLPAHIFLRARNFIKKKN